MASMPWRKLVALLLAVLGGIGLGLLTIPSLYRHSDTDLARVGTVLRALHDESLDPRVVVEGSSVFMCGVDARTLRSELPDRPLVLNLSSPGQGVAESLLYYEQLPPSVRTVVQLLSIDDLAVRRPPPPNSYNAYVMYGGRPDEQTRAALVAAYGEDARALLDAGRIRESFSARWALREAVDQAVRRLLRRDLDLAAAKDDLYFPAPYRERLPPRKIDELYRGLPPRKSGAPLQIIDEQRRVVDALLAAAASRGARVALVLPPVSRRMRDYWGEATLTEYIDVVKQTWGTRSIVIDATHLLGDDAFIDLLHPDPAGAQELTRAIARQLT
jgi:hypothetical protein